MSGKEKLVGIIIILAGAFPLLMKLESFSTLITKYPFLSYVQAGEPVYQIIIILLGVLLLWTPKQKMYGYPPRR